MAKRRRTLLSKTKRTADRAQPREAVPPVSQPTPPVELERVPASDPDPANPTLTPVDDPEPDPTESEVPEPVASEPSTAEPAALEPPPKSSPSLAPEELVAAPAEVRDMAEAEKVVADDADLFGKGSASNTVEPDESSNSDIFPKDFEDGDDWFMRTGQPAPAREDQREDPTEHTDDPIVTRQPNPWPWVLGLLGAGGLVAIVLILLVMFS